MNRRELMACIATVGASALVPGWSLAEDSTSTGEDARLRALLDRFVEQMLRESPESATSLGMDAGEFGGLRSQLDGRSAEDVAQVQKQCRSRLRSLEAIDRDKLSESSLTTYDVVRYAHQLAVDGARFGFGSHTLHDIVSQSARPYVVSQMTGAFVAVPQFLANEHPIGKAADADAYLSRLGQYATALDQETERIKTDRAAGVVPPAFVLDTAIKQMDAALHRNVVETPLVGGFAKRAVAASLTGNWAERAERLVKQQVFPALTRQLAELRSMREVAKDEAGVGSLPDAERYYAWQLRVATTSDRSAEEVHRLGREQSAEIEAQMDALLRKLGSTSGNVGERMAALGRDPDYLFPDNDAGRAQTIEYVHALVGRAREWLPALFNLRLQAPMGVERVPVEVEAGAAGAYVVPGAADGSRPSVFYLNLKSTTTWPKWTLPTLTFHEAVPGHIWQEAFVNEQRPWHPIRSMLKFNAYSEGWALYAEQLVDEIGLHGADIAARLGYLQAQQLRASRMVVDTGLHAKRWTREKAVDWMVRATGRPREVMTSEVDRYCVKPGQACGYKMGQIAILDMRARAQAALGASFNPKAFNDALLTAGNCPMGVLAETLERKFVRGATR